MRWRTAAVTCASSGVLLAALSCRGVLGLGDPEPYDDDGGFVPKETPVVTESAAACGNTNLVTDAKNCGRCGHDCRGGRCERARCVPIQMTTSDSALFAVHDGSVFAVDKRVLVHAEEGKVVRVAGVPELNNPRAMLANNVHVVWSGDDGVHLCSTTGCSADGPTLLSGAGKATGPVAELHGLGQVYPYIWANYTDSTVEKAAALAGPPVVLSTNTHVRENPCVPGFAAGDAGTFLYDTPQKHFWVYRASEATGRDAGGADSACVVTANATTVFYTDATTIWRAAINPDGTLAPRVPFAENVAAPHALAADDEFVYWAGSTAVTDIVRCRVGGCNGAPEIVVEAIPTVSAIQVDGPFVFFASLLNTTLGTIVLRVAK